MNASRIRTSISFMSCANESFADFAAKLQKEIEEDTGMKFGVLQLDMFAGLTFQPGSYTGAPPSTRKRPKNWWIAGLPDGSVEKWKADAELVAAEEKISADLESGKITSPPNPVTEVMRQVKMGATARAGCSGYCGYHQYHYHGGGTYPYSRRCSELMQHFEKKGYISSTGKIKDTMKVALKNGTLDLPQKYEAAP